MFSTHCTTSLCHYGLFQSIRHACKFKRLYPFKFASFTNNSKSKRLWLPWKLQLLDHVFLESQCATSNKFSRIDPPLYGADWRRIFKFFGARVHSYYSWWVLYVMGDLMLGGHTERQETCRNHVSCQDRRVKNWHEFASAVCRNMRIWPDLQQQALRCCGGVSLPTQYRMSKGAAQLLYRRFLLRIDMLMSGRYQQVCYHTGVVYRWNTISHFRSLRRQS